MANHKWESLNNPYGDKADYCVKCGIERWWVGGCMQGYEYINLRADRGINSPKSTFTRPECKVLIKKEKDDDNSN